MDQCVVWHGRMTTVDVRVCLSSIISCSAPGHQATAYYNNSHASWHPQNISENVFWLLFCGILRLFKSFGVVRLLRFDLSEIRDFSKNMFLLKDRNVKIVCIMENNNTCRLYIIHTIVHCVVLTLLSIPRFILGLTWLMTAP